MAHQEGCRFLPQRPRLRAQVPRREALRREFVTAGTIIVRQRGTKFHPGTNVRRASDDSLFTVVDGQVRFEHKNKKRFRVSVHPVAAAKN